LEIVRILTKQLKGLLEFVRHFGTTPGTSRGTTFQISFPEE